MEFRIHICRTLLYNFPFFGGNKRIGILSILVFLELNDLSVICTDDELISLGLGLADSSISEAELIEWIISHN